MRVLFVHGHKFRKIGNRIYSPGGLHDEILSRYVDLFGEVTVTARIIEEETPKSTYGEITNPHVRIVTDQSMEKLVQEADAVIIRLPSQNGYQAVHAAKKLHKPYLVEVVGCVWDAYWNYSLKGKLVALPAMLEMKRCVKDAPYAIYVSQQFLQRRYPTRGKSIGLSDVELQEMDENVLANRLRKIEKGEKKLVIGTTAAINVPYKGQEFVIRALPEIRKRLNREVEYHLVGGGDPERLQRIAQECGVSEYVHCIGTLPHDQVFDFLDRIDIYAQPSKQEGLCRALVEAMSRGLPCVASDTGGNPELLDSEYIFSKRSDRSLTRGSADTICKLADPQNMKRAAQDNFRHAQRDFERDTLKEKRDAFYRDFIENEVKTCQK